MRNFYFVVFFTAIWCIWNESTDWHIWVSGVFFSLLMRFVLRFLGRSVDQKTDQVQKTDYFVVPWRLILFSLLLTGQIFKSSIDTMGRVIKGNVSTELIVLKTPPENLWIQALTANAVTLTPGTVTLDMAGDTYTILCLSSPDDTDHEAPMQQMIDRYKQILTSNLFTTVK